MKKLKIDLTFVFQKIKIFFSNVAMSQPHQIVDVASSHTPGTQDNSWSSKPSNLP